MVARVSPDDEIGKEPTIWAECLFVDPVSDIALLGEPDGQSLCEQWERYDEFLTETKPLTIRTPRADTEDAWLCSLDGHLFRCKADSGKRIRVWDAAEGTRGGMSGSPIVGSDGKATGVFCFGTSKDGEDFRQGGPQPFGPVPCFETNG
jgi:hypothetical protein